MKIYYENNFYVKTINKNKQIIAKKYSYNFMDLEMAYDQVPKEFFWCTLRLGVH